MDGRLTSVTLTLAYRHLDAEQNVKEGRKQASKRGGKTAIQLCFFQIQIQRGRRWMGSRLNVVGDVCGRPGRWRARKNKRNKEKKPTLKKTNKSHDGAL